MAYKFQLGTARMSGSLVQEGDLTLSGSMELQSGKSLVIGAASMNEADLEQIDGITAGTVAASKAVVVDANKDANGFRNIDGTGDLTMGTVTMTGFSVDADGDTALKSLAVDNSSTIGCDADADIMTLAAQSLALANDVDFNVAKAGGLQIAGVAVTATAAELNYLDNSDLTAADITKLAALTATAAEINYLDNDDLTAADITKLAALTATAAEINYLDNDDLSAARIAYLAGVTGGTALASKAVVLDANKDVTGITNITASFFKGNGAALTNISSDTVDTTTSDASATRYIPFVDQSTGADGESLLIHSAVAINPATGVFTIAGSAPSIGIGSAVLTEGEMEMLDGITAGTVAASKAVVVDASKDISGLRNVTATGYFEIGSAQLTESEMEMLDGITAGTAAASKAVVVDASKDISGLNDVSAAGLTLSDLTSGRLPLVSTSGLLADNAQISYDVGRNFNGYNNIAVSSSASGSGYLGDGLLYIGDASQDDILFASGQGVGMGYDSTLQSGEGDNVFYFSPGDGEVKWQYDNFAMFFGKDGDVSIDHVADTGLRLNSSRQLQFGDSGTYIHQSADGVLDLVSDTEIEINATTIDVNGALDVSGNSTLGGTLTAANLGTSTVDLTADLMIINDGAGGVIKNTSLAQYATALAAGANEGLSSTAGRLEVDLSDLVVGDFSHGSWYNSTFAFVDVNDSDITKKETIADLVTKMAGAGLTATNGVLSSDASPTPTDHGDAAGTLVEGLNFSDTAFSAARSWTLPASPDLGDKIIVKAPTNAGTYNLTIVKVGSQQIDGVAQDLLIESDNGAVTLVYAKADRWVVS